MTAGRYWTDVRGLIEKQTGPVLAAQCVTEGLNSEIAIVVHTSLGATFVKGLRGDHCRAWTQQREAEINPYVVPIAPRLRWHVEEDGWNLLGFEHVAGHRVGYSPGSPDLPKVVHALRLLGQIPYPDLPLKVASGHGGFVEYYRGYSWLKMPLQDGQKLLNTLLGTAFHDRVTIRWQPGSWRMHVPFRYEKSSGIGLADAAQIYFPREQIAELTVILNRSAG